MKKQSVIVLFALGVLLLLGGKTETTAQDATDPCSEARYDEILDLALEQCLELDSSEICYAYPRITSLFSDGRLFRSGNQESLIDFRELITESQRIGKDGADVRWGIATLRVQSPDIMEGGFTAKDVTLVVYGSPKLSAAGQTENGTSRFVMEMQSAHTATCSEIFKEGMIVEVPANVTGGPERYVGEVMINGILLRLESRALLTMTADSTRFRVTGLEGAVTVTDSSARTETLEPGEYLETQFVNNDLTVPEIVEQWDEEQQAWVAVLTLPDDDFEALAAHPQELGALYAAHTHHDLERELPPGEWKSTDIGDQSTEQRVIVPGDVDVWFVNGAAGQNLTVYLACPDSDDGSAYRCLSVGLKLPELNIYTNSGVLLGRSDAPTTTQTQLSVPLDQDGQYFVVAGGDEISTGRYVICAELTDSEQCGAIPYIVNRPPEITLPGEATVEMGLEERVDVSVSDPDGGDITRITPQSADDGIVTVWHENPLVLTGVSEGTTTITVTAEDADGKQASRTMNVSVICVPCKTWGYTYTVSPGDTLFNIGARIGVTVDEMQRANCLQDPQLIVVGQQICVPSVPPFMPNLTVSIDPAATSAVCNTGGNILTSYPDAPCIYTVTFTVSNHGSAPSTPTDTVVQAGMHSTYVGIQTLGLGQSQTFTTQVAGTTDCFINEQPCPIRVEVDVNQFVAETIEIDNAATTSIAAPYIVLSDLQAHGIHNPVVNANGTTTVEFVILNGSDVPVVTPFTALIEGSGLMPKTVQVVGGIPPEGILYVRDTLVGTWESGVPLTRNPTLHLAGFSPADGSQPDRAQTGPCWIRVTLDTTNQIREADEFNNIRVLQQACPSLPQLSPPDVTEESETPEYGVIE